MRAFALCLAFSLPGLVACEKKSETPVADPAPGVSAPAPSIALLPPPPSSEPVPTAAATATTPNPAPAPPPATAGSVAKAKANDGKDAGGPAPVALKPASKQVTGNNFALDVASPGCKAGEDCALTIRLLPKGEYHVNKEYPYKFIATPAPGVAFLGKSDANTFGRTSGDFVEQGEKAAVLTVRFKPAAAGEAKVTGKYKLSVCSADKCQIDEALVDLAVPVM